MTLALAAFAAVLLASGALAHGTTTTITISDQMRGSRVVGHVRPLSANLSLVVRSGAASKFVTNDVVPQKLVQTKGPEAPPHACRHEQPSTTAVKLIRLTVRVE